MSAALKISLADLEAFDPQAERGGNERRCRCPICQAKERSFCFNATTGLYTCQRASCGARGKLCDFWEEKPRQNARQRARTALDMAFGVSLPQDTAHPEKTATAATWREIWEQGQMIEQGTSAMEYLVGRGLELEVVQAARVRSLSLYGRQWVAFPFAYVDGNDVAFQARAADGGENAHRAYGPKKAGVFYTSAAALKSETVYITEAPIDALSLAMCGRRAIALGGVVFPEWLLQALAFRCVALAFDNDSNGAGRKAASEMAPSLTSFGSYVFRMKPERAYNATKGDWNMMLKELGAGRLTQWLNYYESKAVVKLGKTWKRPE